MGQAWLTGVGHGLRDGLCSRAADARCAHSAWLRLRAGALATEFGLHLHGARAAAGHLAATPDDLTILTLFYVSDSAARVREDAEPAVEQFVRVASSLLASSARGWASPAEGARMNALLEKLRAATFDTINTDVGIFATPDGCLKRIGQVDRRFHPGRMICWFNFLGAIPHQRVLDGMELFSAKVLPDLSVL